MIIAINIALGIAGGSICADGNPIAGAALMLAGILLGIRLKEKGPPSKEEAR